MCQAIYISSQRELPEINFYKEKPGFYIHKTEHEGTLRMLKPILKGKFIYEALSHMGCSCGLFYDESFKNDESFEQRKKDVMDFAEFLDTHKKENNLQLFSTEWVEFPASYHVSEFRTSKIDQNEFEIEEMTILTVV